MERQTSERVDLYVRRLLPGYPLPINVKRTEIDNDAPSDKEIRTAVSKLSNGRAAGASGMRAEHTKEWLRGIRQEDDPERLGGGPGDGDHWRLFVQLVQAAWIHGEIPRQLLWIIVVLIPKGGGDLRGIGLLEPIWKVIERIIDHWLNAFNLHDSLHGCRNKRGTGTAIIKAKLAQQLSHIELKPFYGIFLDLRKAFDAMDRERCILIFGGLRCRTSARSLGANVLAGCDYGVSGLGILRHTLQSRLWCHPRRAAISQAVQYLGRCSRTGVVLAVAGEWGIRGRQARRDDGSTLCHLLRQQRISCIMGCGIPSACARHTR
jgi:hypothetical protein